MKLAYRAFDKTGREVTDRIEAGNADEARDKLRRQGLFVTDISEAGAVPVGGGKSRGGGRRTRRRKDLAMFTRQ